MATKRKRVVKKATPKEAPKPQETEAPEAPPKSPPVPLEPQMPPPLTCRIVIDIQDNNITLPKVTSYRPITHEELAVVHEKVALAVRQAGQQSAYLNTQVVDPTMPHPNKNG